MRGLLAVVFTCGALLWAPLFISHGFPTADRPAPLDCAAHHWGPVEVWWYDDTNCQPGLIWYVLRRECVVCGLRELATGESWEGESAARAIYRAWEEMVGR